jgi:MurNAc alpha-1-phosphate uridylyltransferase
MEDEIAGVVLAAGAGTRLAPLTTLRPKALCPIGNRPLVDLAIERLSTAGIAASDMAVNLHHRADQLDAHLPARIHRSFEEPVALGTAGALGALRPWIDGRHVIVTNADAWLPGDLDLSTFLKSWDQERVRLLCVHDPMRGDFGALRYCGVALMPAARVSMLDAMPSGLYEVMWRAEAEAGRLDLVEHGGAFVDCGTARDYLLANLLASGGESVIGDGASVGVGAVIERSVVWDHSEVSPGEHLRDAIRAEDVTVLIR